jgi:hypothetical protein
MERSYLALPLFIAEIAANNAIKNTERYPKERVTINMVTQPTIDASSYLEEDSIDAHPKHGTTVQAGWGAASKLLKSKEKSSGFPANFKFSEQPTLVRFLDDGPFHVYEEHWVDRTEGRRSFVALEEDDPLTVIAGLKPRAKFAFNVLVLSDGEPTVQIMTAGITLARLLLAAHEDSKRGPLTKFYWTVSRLGMGRDTQYSIERVRPTDLAEEWELDPDEIEKIVSSSVKYDKSAIYMSPREEMIEVARQLVS